mmetsp:Transcript_35356/g.87974  ORF Transcript_35356/g.87974 Transcript_35356/m.87974 type:complete len:414 (+) Transcript_35356:2220-3461(+)
MRKQVGGLHLAKVFVRLAIVPRDRVLLRFGHRAWGAFCKVLEDRLDRVKPVVVPLESAGPVDRAAAEAVVDRVLCHDPHWQIAEPLRDERALATGDDDDSVPRVGREDEQVFPESISHRNHVFEGGVVDQGAKEPHDDQPAVGLPVRVDDRRDRQLVWRLEREHHRVRVLLLGVQLVHKVFRPLLYRELGDILGHELMSLFALLLRHVQRVVDSARHFVGVERIDQNRARAQGLSASAEFGENQHAMIPLLASHELERHLGHSLAKRCDESDLREEIESAKLDEVYRMVKIVDRSVRQSREPPVDAADELMHLVPQLLVARGVLLGWCGDLDEHDLLRPLRVGVEELLECNEFVRDPLDIIHPVDTQDELLSVKPTLQLDHLVLQLRRGQHLLELSCVDPNREGIHSHGGALR